jgi:23S rRNA pseudouridine1911/1915/1917 synthase
VLNRGYAYATTIGRGCEGQSLLLHLAELYPHSTLEVWQERLALGEVRLDGVRAQGSEVVRVGQRLVWARPPWEEEETPRDFAVLYEDDVLLAVNKPSGLPTLPGGGFLENTLLYLVQARWPEANPVHRLGRGTSGVVLFAKTALAAARLSAAWNTAGVEKVYRALAQGIAAQDAYDIETPIGLVPHPRIGSVWAAHPGGKASKSCARVITRGEGTTLFEVRLETGRPHQIRIHLASIGYPLVGDPLYGVGGLPLEALPGLPGDGGYYLHAQTLRFVHPITGEAICVEAD